METKNKKIGEVYGIKTYIYNVKNGVDYFTLPDNEIDITVDNLVDMKIHESNGKVLLTIVYRKEDNNE